MKFLAILTLLACAAIVQASHTETVRHWQRTQIERHICHLSLLSANESSIEANCNETPEGSR